MQICWYTVNLPKRLLSKYNAFKYYIFLAGPYMFMLLTLLPPQLDGSIVFPPHRF